MKESVTWSLDKLEARQQDKGKASWHRTAEERKGNKGQMMETRRPVAKTHLHGQHHSRKEGKKSSNSIYGEGG